MLRVSLASSQSAVVT